MMQENPEYRYHKLWLMIGYMLVLLVVYYSLIGKPPMPSPRIVFFEQVMHPQRYFDKFSHLMAYFVLMGWFAQIYHVKKLRVAYAVSFVLLGIALELIQGFEIIRKLELFDMLANSSGVLLAFLLTKIASFRKVLIRIESYI